MLPQHTPPTIWYQVLEQLVLTCEDDKMSSFIQYSQVNQTFRRYFLSNAVWARFDIHRVKSKSPPPYIYNGYILSGIAGHYYNYLVEADPARRRWHMSTSFQLGMPDWTNLYDHINNLYLFPWYFGYDRGVDPCIPLQQQPPMEPYEHLVRQMPLEAWRLYTELLHYRRQWNCPGELYRHLLRDKQICLGLMASVGNFEFWRIPGLRLCDDWDVNMLMAQLNNANYCHKKFWNNPDFSMALMHKSLWCFGRFELHFEPVFLRRLMNEFPELLEFIEENYRHMRSEAADGFRHMPDHLGLRRLPRLLATPKIVLRAMQWSRGADLLYAVNDRDNEHVVREAMKQSNGWCFKYASERLRDDLKMVLWGVRQWPCVWRHASQRLQRDPLVLATYGLRSKGPRPRMLLNTGPRRLPWRRWS